MSGNTRARFRLGRTHVLKSGFGAPSREKRTPAPVSEMRYMLTSVRHRCFTHTRLTENHAAQQYVKCPYLAVMRIESSSATHSVCCRAEAIISLVPSTLLSCETRVICRREVYCPPRPSAPLT